jgi:uncharacterized membrane protein
MPEKRSKYDTDPLDPDFVRRADETMASAKANATNVTEAQPSSKADEDLPDPKLDEPTRRFGEGFANSYPSVFVPPVYQPPAHQQNFTSFDADAQQHPAQPATPEGFSGAPLTARKVQKLGIAENVACVLPYAPFWIGVIAALAELFIVPRTETRTRFHAAQGLALQLVLIVGALAFQLIETLTGSGLGGSLFWLASTIFLVVSMVRVWSGQPHHIAPLDDLTRRINEKIEPKGKT